MRIGDVTCMRLIEFSTKFNFVGLIELSKIFDILPLWLSKNSWSLLAAREMLPVGLPKNSIYMPACSLYWNGKITCIITA